MAEPLPSLYEDMRTFADTIEGETPSEDVLAVVITAFRMFSIEAKTLEDELLLLRTLLNAADCRIEALTIPDYLGEHLREAAISDGVRAGRIVDLRAVFRAEQEYNCSRDDGDAA